MGNPLPDFNPASESRSGKASRAIRRIYRPAFTVLLPTHAHYVGGDFYFADDLDPLKVGYYVFQEIPLEERNALEKPDGRRFKLDDMLSAKQITMLRKAVTSFIVGACIRQLQQSAAGEKEQYYSFIIHTERSKAAPFWLLFPLFWEEVPQAPADNQNTSEPGEAVSAPPFRSDSVVDYE